jgi:hypothetical protein
VDGEWRVLVGGTVVAIEWMGGWDSGLAVMMGTRQKVSSLCPEIRDKTKHRENERRQNKTKQKRPSLETFLEIYE